jgi:hypothetical protein
MVIESLMQVSGFYQVQRFRVQRFKGSVPGFRVLGSEVSGFKCQVSSCWFLAAAACDELLSA